MFEPKYEISQLEWNGILIEVRYCRSWSPSFEEVYGYGMAHIEIESIEPARAVLPITPTGYKSHFAPEGEIADAGGALDYVGEALKLAAADPAWKAQEEAARQYKSEIETYLNEQGFQVVWFDDQQES